MVLTNPLKLKAEIKKKIKTDGKLYGIVSDAADILPESLPRSLRNNASTLTQKKVLMAIAHHLSCEENDLLETEPEAETETKKTA